MLEHPQDGVAAQTGKAAHPHRDAADGKTFGEDGTLRRDDLLTVQAGSRTVQQKVNGEGRVVLFVGTAEDAVIVQTMRRQTRSGSRLPLRATRALGCWWTRMQFRICSVSRSTTLRWSSRFLA